MLAWPEWQTPQPGAWPMVPLAAQGIGTAPQPTKCSSTLLLPSGDQVLDEGSAQNPGCGPRGKGYLGVSIGERPYILRRHPSLDSAFRLLVSDGGSTLNPEKGACISFQQRQFRFQPHPRSAHPELCTAYYAHS